MNCLIPFALRAKTRKEIRYRTMSKKSIRSQDLGINLKSKHEEDLFRWFLACLLFGKPIQQKVAQHTYFEFVREGLVTPDAILKAGWDKLVEVLDRGHYVRYDFSTAAKLLHICRELEDRYGSVTGLLEQSENRKSLIRRLQQFDGIGPVTTRIFLRDVGPIWFQ
ncbi:MAG: DNA methylase [Acidobacteria bacterium]|nr:DNA methylase [Acidobacteriota bacterium]